MNDTDRDKDLDETKRIMERLVKQPPQPHKPHEKADDDAAPVKRSDNKESQRKP
ncbi:MULTISPECIES: hypothetical protein [unclassified Mesorhizobium]|uniref:hypothetical protein n=1 Tax=unclassified Mesorhizobium TaxID=325217 RepID=UPI0033385650